MGKYVRAKGDVLRDKLRKRSSETLTLQREKVRRARDIEDECGETNIEMEREEFSGEEG